MQTIELTAFEAAALDPDTAIKIKGGRTVYEGAQMSRKDNTVRLSRLQITGSRDSWPYQVNRYVDPDTVVVLEINAALRQKLIDVGYYAEDDN